MKSKIIVFIIIAIFIVSFSCIIIYSNTKGLKGLEKEVSKIALPQNIEKIAIKSKIGDSGGNGEYSTYRVVLLVKTEITLDELKQEFENMNLKFSNHYDSCNNIPIFYITHCKGNIFKSSRSFSLEFNELNGTDDYNNYYFIEFVE